MVIYTHPRLQHDTPRKNALNWSTLRQLRCAMWAKVSTAATWHAQCWRLWQQCPEKSQFLAHQFIYREVLDLFMFFCWMIISCSYRPLISHPYTKKKTESFWAREPIDCITGPYVVVVDSQFFNQLCIYKQPRKKESSRCSVWTTYFTLWKWPLRRFHHWRISLGSNRPTLSVSWQRWTTWATCWEGFRYKKPRVRCWVSGPSIEPCFHSTSFGGMLIAEKRICPDASLFTFMVTREPHTNEVGFWLSPFKVLLGLDLQKGQKKSKRSTVQWETAYLLIFYALGSKPGCQFAFAPRSAWVWL